MTPDQLIRALLPHVPFDGWGRHALAAAARDCGLGLPEAGVYLPESAIGQIEAWLALADQDLAADLAARNLGALKMRERIALAVRRRLELAEPHKEAVRRASAVLALPQNVPLALRAGWRTADVMWRAAGDTATDFNHYSKRMLLGGVYAATLLCWLQDDSDGHAETWAFLDRRIQGILQIEKVKADCKKGTAQLPSLTRFLGRLRYPAY